MDDLERGTEEGYSGWFLREAECSDGSSDEEEQNNSFESISDFIDDGTVNQGNSLQAFQNQSKEETERQIQALKRKYIHSPEAGNLSPRLRAISITPEKQRSKRRLFETDSGNWSDRNETQDSAATSFEVVGDSAVAVSEAGHSLNLNLLGCHNRLARLYALVKEAYGVGFKELTRQYRSDKTCNPDWVCATFSVREEVLNAARAAILQACEYVHIQHRVTVQTPCTLMLLRFKHGKSRETVKKFLTGILHVDPLLCLCDPPKIQSVPAALYWYKTSMSPATFHDGELPDWVKKQTVVSCSLEDSKFDLSEMVQWAYDNGYEDECTIAYEYARKALEDPNANAFLASNSQAKHVKDCTVMVRHYKRAEMKNMSMSQWIHKCCSEEQGGGDWKPISLYLRSQGVEVVRFLGAMRYWLKGIPKKNCIAICGPPNTGKSMFCMSLIKFLKGRVLSFANSKSHFWMQPLAEAKLVLLDDATRATWDYVDTYLRNALDGNPLSIDCKYRAPMQIKCPPILITTNEDIKTNDRWRYLHSRVTMFYFNNPLQLDGNGDPQYCFTNSHWKSFFERLQRPLDLSEDEAEQEDGESVQPFVCSARGTDVYI
uniref:Replication protein E1 n=1 Tax=Rattus norvegicus papillomavirus 2 TaxID=1036965 RepID=A0A385KLM0_MNPV|nr:E1 [Rattus norvegicus papillomavirus 2]AXZ95684.1 E1 [Rattus norvegicus papillomavirus 2]AXZ95689.1 E1 [Rattus norvegicus papillomavirus 2]AXZ95694.1 E1 [Rattus norvegicus papillomavirus 2]